MRERVVLIKCQFDGCNKTFRQEGLDERGRVDKGMPANWGHNSWGYSCPDHTDPTLTYEFSPEAFRKDLEGFRDRVRESLEEKMNRVTVQCYERGCARLAEIEPVHRLLALPPGWTQQWVEEEKDYLYFCPVHRTLRPRTGRVMTELFETNPILNVLDELRETLKAKQADYAGTDPFNNFTESAATADITPRQAALTLLGVKLSRIRNLERQNNEAANEPLLDSYLDLAGYAIILYAMAKEAK